MLEMDRNQMKQYNDAIEELREKLREVGEFKDVVLILAGPQAVGVEVGELKERIKELEKEIIKLKGDVIEIDKELIINEITVAEAIRLVERFRREIPIVISRIEGTEIRKDRVLAVVANALK